MKKMERKFKIGDRIKLTGKGISISKDCKGAIGTICEITKNYFRIEFKPPLYYRYSGRYINTFPFAYDEIGPAYKWIKL